MPSKGKMALGVIIFSITLVVLYDLRSIWKNRPGPCDPFRPECPADRVCSRPENDLPARCIPKASDASTVFRIPFEEKMSVTCRYRNFAPEKHSTDFNLFALTLQPLGRAQVLAAASGEVFIHKNEIRILHKDGYVSSYSGLDSITVGDGRVGEDQVIGTTQNAIEFAVHYYHPQADSRLLKDSPRAGFSVPFRMKVNFVSGSPHELHSTEIPCGESPTNLYR